MEQPSVFSVGPADADLRTIFLPGGKLSSCIPRTDVRSSGWTPSFHRSPLSSSRFRPVNACPYLIQERNSGVRPGCPDNNRSIVCHAAKSFVAFPQRTVCTTTFAEFQQQSFVCGMQTCRSFGNSFFEAIAQAAKFEVSLNACKKLLLLERLRNKVHRAELQPFDTLPRFVQGTQKNHGNMLVSRACFQSPANLETINPAHSNVENNQVRLCRTDRAEREFAAVRGRIS